MSELEKLLEEFNIPKERRKFYSLENGFLIVPTIETLFKNGVIKENDFEYKEWLKNKDKPPQLTEVEVLKKEKEALAKYVFELTEIVELIITGGVNQ